MVRQKHQQLKLLANDSNKIVEMVNESSQRQSQASFVQPQQSR